MKFFYRKTERDGQWRWRLLREEGNLVAQSADAYETKQLCLHAMDQIRKFSAQATVDEETGD